MRKTLLIATLLTFAILSAQDKSADLVEYKLQFEGERWNSQAGETERIIIRDSTPTISYEFKHNNGKMLVAIFTGYPNVIVTYAESLNTWHRLHQKRIGEGRINMELKFHEDEVSKYIYLENFIYGGSAGNVYCYFTLYDILNNEIYKLEYAGAENPYSKFSQAEDGKFNTKELIEHPTILAYLEKEAAKSSMIKRD